MCTIVFSHIQTQIRTGAYLKSVHTQIYQELTNCQVSKHRIIKIFRHTKETLRHNKTLGHSLHEYIIHEFIQS